MTRAGTKAFTLLELLATLIVAAIVVGIAVPVYVFVIRNATEASLETQAQNTVSEFSAIAMSRGSTTHSLADFRSIVSEALSSSSSQTAARFPGSLTSPTQAVYTSQLPGLALANGPLDVRVCANPHTWRNASQTLTVLASTYNTGGTTWVLYLRDTGRFSFYLYSPSNSAVTSDSNAAFPADLGPQCVRVTFDPTTMQVVFYRSSTGADGSWVPVGTPKTISEPGGAASWVATTQRISLGVMRYSAAPQYSYTGDIYEASAFVGPNKVAHFDITERVPGETSWVSDGVTYTVASPAALVAAPWAVFGSAACVAYEVSNGWIRLDWGSSYSIDSQPSVTTNQDPLAC